MKAAMKSFSFTALALFGVSAGAAAERQNTSATNEAGDARDLEEVIVTAQKRAERLQDVPISISVLGGEELDNLTTEGVLDALNRVPGVVTTSQFTGGGAQLTVRGVSAGAAQFAGSSPIAYYLDAVPFGLVKTALVPNSNVYDLERIEVLRGPQGTLYGASAQNGVVRVLTMDPQLSDFEMKGRATLSTTDEGGENYRGDMSINLPMVDGKVAARAVLGYENMSGWIDKPNNEDVNDAESTNFRLKIKGQISDEFSVGVLTWLSRSDYGSPSSSDVNYRRSSPSDESGSSDYDVQGLKLSYDASKFSVVSMTSYLDYQSSNGVDLIPFTGSVFMLNTELDSEVFAEEVIVNSTSGGPWRWTAGVIYRDAKDRLQQFNAGVRSVDFSDRSKSFATFGEITRALIGGRLELTGGLRYFEDDVTQVENERSSVAGPIELIRNNDTFDAVSPRLVISLHPTVDSTVYASYSEGFRSGFNQNANVIRDSPAFPPLKADTLKNYEIGAKGALGSRLLTFDAALYYMDWDDVQQTLSVRSNGNLVTALVNGAGASGLGFEMGITSRPIERLEVGINFSWNDLTADSDLVTAGLSLYDKGDRLSFSSEYTAGAYLSYTFAIFSGYEAQFSTSGSYYSKQTYRNSLGPGSVNIDEGEPQTIARVGLTLDFSNGWTGTAFVDNVTNENSRGTGLFGIADWTQRVRPRTTGLQFDHRF